MAEDRARHPELKITVQNDGTVKAEIPGEDGAGDGKLYTDDLLRETLITFRDWLNQGKLKIERERELILLGKLLYRLLFAAGGPRITQFVYNKLKEGRDSRKRICLQLAFEESQGELASLPWEFLYDPQSKCFFATNNDLILTRFVAECGGARKALSSNELPLRMLIVVSTKGGGSVASEDVVKAIQEFAEANRDRITLDGPLLNQSYEELQRWLKVETTRPHIVHFIGHGRYNKAKRQGEVALAKAAGSGEAQWWDQDQFRRLFTDVSCFPRLLFLQLCQGAVVEEAELIASFAGLAPTLISQDTQAVVAMQFPITNKHARMISTKFYDELNNGSSVGEAVQAARRVVSISDPVAGGTPVLYMYGYDGAIVSPPKAPQTTGDSPPGAYAGAAGSWTGKPDSGPTPARPSPAPSTSADVARDQDKSDRTPARPGAAPEPTPGQPPSVGLSIELNEILNAGDRKIKEMKLEQKEATALSKKLYVLASRELRGKTVLEIKLALAELSQRETDPQLSKVLDAMFDAAGTMS